MNDANLEYSGIELDLGNVVSLAVKYWRRLLLAAVLGAGITLAAAYFLLPPQYQSSVLFYVNNGAVSGGNAAASVSSGDLSTSRNLVDSYIVILKTRESLLDVIRYAGVDIPYLELEDMISASDVNKTEFFRVVVTGPDPYEAEKIANAIGHILPEKIAAIIEGTTARMVEPAIAAWKPSTPGYGKYALMGFFGGLALSLAWLLLWRLADDTIRDPEDVERLCGYPVLASVPTQGKGKKADPACAMAEVCRQVRTKLPFLLPDGTCRVIGISGATGGAEIHRAAAELSRSLSVLNRKVLLVDADLRQENRTEKHIPGLSEILFGKCGTAPNGDPVALSGGESAIDPLDLLGSGEMKAFLRQQRETCDDILLELPSPGEYSDALTVAGELDGVLLVVALDRCKQKDLQKTVRQLEFGGIRVLGAICVGALEAGR